MLTVMWRRLPIVVWLASGSVAAADPSALDALLARTDQVAKEVAKVRGLPLKHAIPNEVVDRDELRARLVKLAADRKTASATAAEGLGLARWGMIPLATDYTHMLVDLLTDQIAGYYDPETKKLTISKAAGDDATWADMVLVHELDHGLQDQTFDLTKFDDLPDSEADAAAARHALIEGDGIALMIEVAFTRAHKAPPWGDPTIAAQFAQAMAVPTGDSLDAAPLALREAMMFPYRAGFVFVAALRRRQTWRAVDAAFRRPPKSTEQILHPEKYVADELPVTIAATAPAALPDYAIAHTTVWGELGFDLFLASHGVDPHLADRAAAGWGGDRVITLAKAGDTRPERAVGLARFDWDTEVDAIEAHEAAVRALDGAIPGATVDHRDTFTRWLALDGTATWVERRGSSIVIAIGVPSWAADALASEAWTALAVVPRPPPPRPANQANK